MVGRDTLHCCRKIVNRAAFKESLHDAAIFDAPCVGSDKDPILVVIPWLGVCGVSDFSESPVEAFRCLVCRLLNLLYFIS